MPTYAYPDPGGNPSVMMLNIERQGLPLPDSISDNDNQVFITYETDLTPAQKTSLDSLMAQSTIGQIPTTSNSIYTMEDLCDFRSTFNTLLAPHGLSVTCYPDGKGKVRILFNKQLNNSDKNNLRSVVLNFLKQIQ